MFKSVERNTIKMVLLEGCGGNMDQAVEALLLLTGGASKNVNKQPQQSQQRRQMNSFSSVRLPDDFLRPPSYYMMQYKAMNKQ